MQELTHMLNLTAVAAAVEKYRDAFGIVRNYVLQFVDCNNLASSLEEELLAFRQTTKLSADLWPSKAEPWLEVDVLYRCMAVPWSRTR